MLTGRLPIIVPQVHVVIPSGSPRLSPVAEEESDEWVAEAMLAEDAGEEAAEEPVVAGGSGQAAPVEDGVEAGTLIHAQLTKLQASAAEFVARMRARGVKVDAPKTSSSEA